MITDLSAGHCQGGAEEAPPPVDEPHPPRGRQPEKRHHSDVP
jgi:hypothetical protein